MSVNIVPDNITYYPPFDEPSKTVKITITNTSDETVTFKVKTTTPKNYCVKPNSEVLKPHQKMDVSIVYLGNDNDLLLSHDPSKPYRCKHKFLIESIPCPYEITDVHKAWASLGTEMKSQLQYKVIRVAFDFVNKKPVSEEAKTEDIIEEKEDTKEIEEPVEEPTKETIQEPVPEVVEKPSKEEDDAANKTVETIYNDEKIEEEEETPTKTVQETQVVEADSSNSILLMVLVVIIAAGFYQFIKK
ncbi:uncharacterized protein HGUI_01249 [Hanseniaspora guilliermondii]|uniref:MSP domain-containing protein n=1 Tax=Hanseniaspora guilliermondii TaxID=56406 RepID=A0A1L0CKX1_9ASCO|nr:uncharacterized protein HGUI_01249 [Hanseniaspora guilliermondii]